MEQDRARRDEPEGDFVAFHETGDPAKGEFRCTGCGYGVAVSAALPLCPMCGGSVWEDAPPAPFRRRSWLRL